MSARRSCARIRSPQLTLPTRISPAIRAWTAARIRAERGLASRADVPPSACDGSRSSNLRADAYAVEDLPPAGDDAVTIDAGRATAGLDVSYPLIRRFGKRSGPDSGADGPDLDLQSRRPRSPHSQRGQPGDGSGRELPVPHRPFPRLRSLRRRAAPCGGRPSHPALGRRPSGQPVPRPQLARRTEEPTILVPTGDANRKLYDPSGLADRASDWVVSGDFLAVGSQIRGWAHATIDSAGEVRRAEIMVDGRWGRAEPGDGQLHRRPFQPRRCRSHPAPGHPDNRNYEFVQFSGPAVRLRQLGRGRRGIMDLERGPVHPVAKSVSCSRTTASASRSAAGGTTRVCDPSGPAPRAYVRLNLATFGGTGYQRDDMGDRTSVRTMIWARIHRYAPPKSSAERLEEQGLTCVFKRYMTGVAIAAMLALLAGPRPWPRPRRIPPAAGQAGPCRRAGPATSGPALRISIWPKALWCTVNDSADHQL